MLSIVNIALKPSLVLVCGLFLNKNIKLVNLGLNVISGINNLFRRQ